MISKFVKEQKRYTQQELCGIFCCSEEKAIPIIRKLKEFGVLKAVKASDIQHEMTDLLDEDVEISDVEVGENRYYYVFTFVGIIIVAGRVLKCYPKYIVQSDEPLDDLRQIIKVLEKYNKKEQIVRMFSENSEERAFNLLAVLLFLLHDYFDNGIYSNTEEVTESNGSGEILWDKTINETFTLISENRPYYVDLQTKRRITNEYDYFQRLHECVLTRASKELRDADLLDIFELTGVDISEEELDDFGDDEYILYRIEKELNTQFNTRKQLVLKTIYSYIANSTHIDSIDCFSIFGTNSFNLVWEHVCSVIMDNQLDRALNSLDLPIKLKDEYNPYTRLINVIDHPFWFGHTPEGIYRKKAADTLRPDIISLYKKDGEYRCIVFDAKYYNLQLERNRPLKGQPGIESVTKQYLYQMAYVEFLRDHLVSYFRNCFLMPTEGNEIVETGYVTMDFLTRMGLADIQIRLLPAKCVYSMYLENSKMDIDTLNL